MSLAASLRIGDHAVGSNDVFIISYDDCSNCSAVVQALQSAIDALLHRGNSLVRCSASKIKKAFHPSVSFTVGVLFLLHIICYMPYVGGQEQAFIQTESDLRYLVDGVAVEMRSAPVDGDISSFSFSDLEDESFQILASPIKFDPPSLDFGEHPIGIPELKRVVLHNPSRDTSIQMLSISSNTKHFHCSFFRDKFVHAGGNTSFDVVYLGREEQKVESNLFIHTSLGTFRYQVSAIGAANPYRLRPVLGLRMPLNSTYTPFIHLYNPHPEPLQVMEMFSSGGDLHLELPSGDSDGPLNMWRIPPYQSLPIMKANFVARSESNHTVFIRMTFGDVF
ncbi:unnamed protein product [Cyprideis torosa]|uniref:Transmembrane protein 131-like N-terminal domain-containing protein n=1 Tax=Cyprideis torosa TaxID=163714 RepID=A0A7R8ZIS7_9CRUS|nr:unnamed protein product [Cyprideis torosa]CAG0885369.1 unnamed protein product [Cyprideis torosa]